MIVFWLCGSQRTTQILQVLRPIQLCQGCWRLTSSMAAAATSTSRLLHHHAATGSERH
jgi:hypothetical protein